MKSRQVVKSDLYDEHVFEFFLRTISSLRNLVQKSGEVHPNFPLLLEDLFRYLYKEEPEILPDEELGIPYRIQREIIEALRAQGLDKLRVETALNEDQAITTSAEIVKALMEIAKKQGSSRQGSGEGSEGDLEKLLREFLDNTESDANNLREILGKGKKRLPTEAESERILNKLEAGLGSQEQFVDRRDELKKSLLATEYLRKFAKSLGRMISTNFRRKLFKVLEGVEEAYEVIEGKDLARLLLSEKYKLIYAPDAFWLRFLQSRLLSYKMRSRRPLGQGPKIYLIDLSGSTHSPNNLRQGLEKLVAIALALYSKKKAPQLVIYFQGEKHMDLPRITLSHPPTVKQWESLATHWGNGGTDFDGPLREAVRIITEDPTFRKADVILLTDGDAPISESFTSWFNEQKRHLGFALISILVDWGSSSDVKDSEVKKISDRVALITELIPNKILRQITKIYDRGDKEAPPTPDQTYLI